MLVYFFNNDLVDFVIDLDGMEYGGISEFGVEVVQEMNCLGIMVDVFYGNDSVFYDVIELLKVLIIVSYFNV